MLAKASRIGTETFHRASLRLSVVHNKEVPANYHLLHCTLVLCFALRVSDTLIIALLLNVLVLLVLHVILVAIQP